MVEHRRRGAQQKTLEVQVGYRLVNNSILILQYVTLITYKETEHQPISCWCHNLNQAVSLILVYSALLTH